MIFINLLLLLNFSFAETLSFNKETGQTIPNFLGEVKIVRGKVFKKKSPGNESLLSIGDKIFKNETVYTEDKSFTKILMIDETEISLAGNSELSFENFEYQSKTERNSLYNFVRGQLSASVKNKAKTPKDIVFKTKNSVLGVRGTTLFINNQEFQEVEITELALANGLAEYKNNLTQLQNELPPGIRIIIAKHKKGTDHFESKNDFTQEDKNILKNPESFLPLGDWKELKDKFKLSSIKSLNPSIPTKQKKIIEEESGSFENLKRLNEKLKQR